MDAAPLQGPVGAGLDGVRPELEHPRGDEAQQDHGEERDVVDPVLGLHARDQRRAPRAVLHRRTHDGARHTHTGGGNKSNITNMAHVS